MSYSKWQDDWNVLILILLEVTQIKMFWAVLARIFVLILILLEVTQILHWLQLFVSLCRRLNPYSTGSNSNPNQRNIPSALNVLILILLEVTQMIGWLVMFLITSTVLILILLEVTQIKVQENDTIRQMS